MQNKLTIGAMLFALGLGGIGAASAQPIYLAPRIYEPGLPPYEIVAIVRSAGLAPLTRPVRRGPDYVLVAGTRNGGQMRVVVDAYEGDILRVTPVGVPRPYPEPAYSYDPRSRFGAVTRYDGVPPVPPRAVPNARIANAPPAAVPAPAMKSAHPPLPRARPRVAATQPSQAPTAVTPVPAVVPPSQQAAPANPPKEEGAPKIEPQTLVPVAPLE